MRHMDASGDLADLGETQRQFRAQPRITFGMIVLNGMPFLPYNLRALYPYAHQIIVVEGASPGAAVIAGKGGHSTDGSLEELRRLAREEDPLGKITVVTAEEDGHSDGFWPGEKDEQSRAYAARATGDYLWQIDVDEFYMPRDMQAILNLLTLDPGITAVTFPTWTVWGDLNCIVDGWYLRRGAGDYHRLFKWGPGYTYISHRPPTVVDERGTDTRTLRWLDARATRQLGVTMYHYSLLFPGQVREKAEYYAAWGLYDDYYADSLQWMADSYLTLRHPYRVHNNYRFPSWLRRFDSRHHPPQVLEMMNAIASRKTPAGRRDMSDAEVLLDSRLYAAGRAFLGMAEPLDRQIDSVRRCLRGFAGSVHRAFDRETGTP